MVEFMTQISIIIPIYNAEDYLNECLDSVVNQTLSDIEIICINDGSSDNSLSIVEEFATKDSRIKIISQKNNGQGSARNKGLNIANGKYIYFMDADDKIELNTLNDCYEIMEKDNLDFVMFQLINYDDENDVFYQENDYDMPKINKLVENNIFSYNDLNHLIFQVAVSPVNKLYNKKFLENINVKFPEDVIFEDNIFFWNVFLNAEKIKFIPQHYYIRRRHSLSTTGNAGIRFVDTLEVHNRIFEIFKKFNLFEEFKRNLFNKKISLANIRFNQVHEEFKSDFFKEMKKDFENMINQYGKNIVLNNLNSENKLIFETVIVSRGFEEFVLLLENSFLKSEVKFNKSKNKELKNEINNIKKENELILSSNSWKITKPLRIIKNSFK